jgi:hypothetical protein
MQVINVISMAIVNFYNENNKYCELARVRVSKVSIVLERFTRLILTTTLATISLLDQCRRHSRAYGVSNAFELHIDLIKTKELESTP